jgi:hypothetical protein
LSPQDQSTTNGIPQAQKWEDHSSLQSIGIVIDRLAAQDSGLKPFLSDNLGHSGNDHIKAIFLSRVSMHLFVFQSVCFLLGHTGL